MVGRPEKSPLASYDFRTMLLVATTGELCRGMVLATLWPYFSSLGGSLVLYGVASSSFSVARMIAAPLFGWWANRADVRLILLTCCLCLVVGNVFFSLYPAIWLFILSRIVIGVGASTLGVSRGYAAEVARSSSEKTFGISRLQSFQFAASTISPLFVVPFVYFPTGYAMRSSTVSIGFSPLNAPAIVLTLLSLLCTALVFCGFRQPDLPAATSTASIAASSETHPAIAVNSSAEEGQDVATSAENAAEAAILAMQEGHDEQQALIARDGTEAGYTRATAAASCTSDHQSVGEATKSDWTVFSSWALIMASTRFSIAVYETLFVIQTTELLQWTLLENSIALACFGALGFALLQYLKPVTSFTRRLMGNQATTRHAEERLLLVGMFCLLAGTVIVLLTPLSWRDPSSGGSALTTEKALRTTQFVVGSILIWSLGFSLTQTLVNGLMAQDLKAKKQAGHMGLLAATGSIARILASIWATNMTAFPVGIERNMSEFEIESGEEGREEDGDVILSFFMVYLLSAILLIATIAVFVARLRARRKAQMALLQ